MRIGHLQHSNPAHVSEVRAIDKLIAAMMYPTITPRGTDACRDKKHEECTQ